MSIIIICVLIILVCMGTKDNITEKGVISVSTGTPQPVPLYETQI